MHIHSSHMSTQAMSLATQSTQRTAEAKKAAAAVRRKLGNFASAVDAEEFPRIEPEYDSNPRDESESDPDSFRKVLSIMA